MDILIQSTYTDDVIFGADTEKEVYNLNMSSKEVFAHGSFSLYMSSKEIFSQGSFKLQKFVTNVQSLQKAVDAQENTPKRTVLAVEASKESYSQSTLSVSASHGEHKLLGMLRMIN